LAAILTMQMMLSHLGFAEAAADVERAVGRAVQNNKLPAELGGNLGTREVGDYIAGAIS
jgi:isocitrate/isopropylmalate dehydrogenase